MSRSKHHGCGRTCGMCKPHKKWKSNSPEDQRPSVQRELQNTPADDEGVRGLQAELDALPEFCTKSCCAPAAEECTCLVQNHSWEAACEYCKGYPVASLRSTEDHKAALAEIERLWGAKRGTPEGDRLEILATLVDAYERLHHPIEAVPRHGEES